MVYQIFRPLNPAEKEGLTELRGRKTIDVLDKFLADLANKQQEYQKLYRPFDSYGARIDFEKMMNAKAEELQKAVDETKVDPTINFGSLDDYANPELFEFVKRTEEKTIRLVAGIKQEVHIGYRYHFKTKKRGNRISIFVPNEDVEKVEKWIEEKKNKKADEVKQEQRISKEISDSKSSKTVNKTSKSK